MKKVMLVCFGVILMSTSCTLFSKRQRQLSAQKEASENGWLEKEHHYRGISSVHERQNDR